MAMGPEEVISRINKAFGGGTGYRTLHAKGRFYDATFTATLEATALTMAEHFNGQPCPVVLRCGAKPITLPLFALKHPRMAASFPATLPGLRSPHSFAETTFYPIHAYGWIAADGTKSWIRYRFVPQATKADRLAEKFEGMDRLSEEIRARLARGPVRHDVMIDIAGDGDDPHDPTAVWKQHRTIKGGVIEATGEAVVDPEVNGKKVVFDPARVVPGIELSEDPILLFRPAAYGVSVDRR